MSVTSKTNMNHSLTTREAADYLGFSPHTIRAKVHNGEIPIIRSSPTGQWRIRKSDLDKWNQDHTDRLESR